MTGFSNSISAEINKGLWKARLAPPPHRVESFMVTRTGEYMLTPFWVSIFLGLFPLLLQIARNSEKAFSTMAGAVCL